MTSRLVIKVGGSLLSDPTTPDRLREFVDSYHDDQINLIVGGGELIDAIRRLDSVHRLDPRWVHWQCIEALRFTYELVKLWLPAATAIDTQARWKSHIEDLTQGVFLCAIDACYCDEDGDALPCDWTTTSDSIAALLAKKLSADEVILLKSCDVNHVTTVPQAASQGLVDAAFLGAIGSLRVRLARL